MRHGIVLFTCDRGRAAAGATELLWGLPDASRAVVEGYLDRLADRVKAERVT